MEMRHDMAAAMDTALTNFARIEDEYERIFGRRYGAVEAIACDDAEIVFVTSGTITSTARLVLQTLRGRGEKLGILKIKLFRPFPVEEIRKALKGAKKIAVIDRNFSSGPAASSPRRSARPCATHRSTRPSSATSPGSAAGM
jgi:pyruvate/2-oxoacid:ferredoxin oxidoreductase alpha subunit